MAFINEYIPPDDYKKYNINELKRITSAPARTGSRCWAIDRKSGSWLYHVGSGFDREVGFDGEQYWYFFWRNHLIGIKTKVMDVKGSGIGQHYSARQKIISIDCPSSHEINRDEMLLDFQAALSVYGPGGMLSDSISSKVEVITIGASFSRVD